MQMVLGTKNIASSNGFAMFRHLYSPWTSSRFASCCRTYTNSSCRFQRPPITTDEGVIIHESDPSTSGDGLGLVWGSVLWPSGTSLAKYVAYQAIIDPLPERKILELGCGTGVVGLTLATLGDHVTLTDSESALWPLLRKSIDSNKIPGDRVHIHGLDWRDPSTFLLSEEFDLVVAADVLYAGMDKLFARALASHLPNEDSRAIVACPFRKDSPLAEFFEASLRLGLSFERLQDKQGRAVGAVTGVDPATAYSQSDFVLLESSQQRIEVATTPSFTSSNERNIQIFRVRRVMGSAQDAATIRRVSRI